MGFSSVNYTSVFGYIHLCKNKRKEEKCLMLCFVHSETHLQTLKIRKYPAFGKHFPSLTFVSKHVLFLLVLKKSRSIRKNLVLIGYPHDKLLQVKSRYH